MLLLLHPLGMALFAISVFLNGLVIPPPSLGFIGHLLLPACYTTGVAVVIMDALAPVPPFVTIDSRMEYRADLADTFDFFCPLLGAIEPVKPFDASHHDYELNATLEYRVRNTTVPANIGRPPYIVNNGTQGAHDLEHVCTLEKVVSDSSSRYTPAPNTFSNDPLVHSDTFFISSRVSNNVTGPALDVPLLLSSEHLQSAPLESRFSLLLTYTFPILAALIYLYPISPKASIASSRMTSGDVDDTVSSGADTADKARTSMDVLRDFILRVKIASQHMRGSFIESLGLLPDTNLRIPSVPALSTFAPSYTPYNEPAIISFNDPYMLGTSVQSYDWVSLPDTSLCSTSDSTSIVKPKASFPGVSLKVDLKDEKHKIDDRVAQVTVANPEPTVATNNDSAIREQTLVSSSSTHAFSIGGVSYTPSFPRHPAAKYVSARRKQPPVPSFPAPVCISPSFIAPSCPTPTSSFLPVHPAASKPSPIEAKVPSTEASPTTFDRTFLLNTAKQGSNDVQHYVNATATTATTTLPAFKFTPAENTTTIVITVESTETNALTGTSTHSSDEVCNDDPKDEGEGKGKEHAQNATEEPSAPSTADGVIAPLFGVEADTEASTVKISPSQSASEVRAQPHFDFGAIRALVASTKTVDVIRHEKEVVTSTDSEEGGAPGLIQICKVPVPMTPRIELADEGSTSIDKADNGLSSGAPVEESTGKGLQAEAPAASKRKKQPRRRTGAQLLASKERRQELEALPFTQCCEEIFQALIRGTSA